MEPVASALQVGPLSEAEKVTVDFSPGLAGWFDAHDVSIAFTSYQSGRLYLLGRGKEKKLALHEALWPQAMGVVGDSQRLYLGTLTQLVRLENVLGAGQLANDTYDRIYVPRNAQTFGHIDFHELGIRADGSVIVVNTRFSCLCEPSLVHSFRPVWQPPFITALAAEDRCHLNGLAMKDGEPAYVTLVAATDAEKGWRALRDGGGQVIDVRANEVVCEGLSMPHSPRWYEGELWVLNSGTGEIGRVDLETSGSCRSPKLPDSCAGWTSMPGTRSSACPSRETAVSRACRSTASWPVLAKNRGAGCRSSTSRPASAANGCGSAVRSPSSSRSAPSRACATR